MSTMSHKLEHSTIGKHNDETTNRFKYPKLGGGCGLGSTLGWVEVHYRNLETSTQTRSKSRRALQPVFESVGVATVSLKRWQT